MNAIGWLERSKLLLIILNKIGEKCVFISYD